MQCRNRRQIEDVTRELLGFAYVLAITSAPRRPYDNLGDWPLMPNAIVNRESGSYPTALNVRHAEEWGPSAQPNVPELNMWDFAARLWRRKAFIFAVVTIGVAATAFIALQFTPRYTATGQVMIMPQQNAVLNTQAVSPGLQLDQETVHSQIEVIRSRRLGLRVVDELQLHKLPEFNPGLAPPPWWRRASWLPQAWAEYLFRADSTGHETNRSELIAQILDIYQSKISVSAVERSRVIRIRATSTDREVAHQIVNTLIDVYSAEQIEAKRVANDQATGWLDERLAELRKRVEEAERAVEVYRAESGLTQGNSGLLATQQLSELSTQVVLTRARRAEVEASLQQVEALQRDEDLGAVPAVLASPAIRSLHEHETELLRKHADLSGRYGKAHPVMRSLRAEIDDVRLKTEGEIRRVIEGLRNEVAAARSRESSLEDSVRQLEHRLSVLNQSGIELRGLETHAETTRLLHQNFLVRLTELREQHDLLRPDVQVVSHASLPIAPSFPKPIQQVIGVALLGFLALGMAVAGMFGRFDRGFRSQEEVEAGLSIPALGMVPATPKSLRKLYEHVISRNHSTYSEAIRALYISLRLSDWGTTLLVSSATPGEGKTTISVSLARLAAKTGKKVLLVDCDLRRPRVHEAFGAAGWPGVAEVLAGEISLDEALYKDEASGTYVLFAGKHSAEAVDLLASPRFSSFMSALRNRADVVIVDSPALTAVGDTLVLSRLADQTVFIVRWLHTRRETVSFALRQLLEAGASVSGVVLSRVDLKKHAKYTYGDSGYYHGRNKKYYIE